MWKITALDYDAALFGNPEARLGTGFGQTLWAKHLHRGLFAPTRHVKGGRGGQYAARDIFRILVIHVMGEQAGISPSEAVQIANLAAKGSWNVKELAGEPKNWRSYVLRDSRPPLDVFLIFSKTENCWVYDMSIGPPGADSFKNSASVILAAARELTAVAEYCLHILHEPGRAVSAGDV